MISRMLVLILALRFMGSASAEEVNWTQLGALPSADEASPAEIYEELIEEGILTPPSSDRFSGKRGEQNASYRAVVDVFKRPKLGTQHEFLVVSVDGQVRSVHVVSTAKNGKITIEGAYPLRALKLRGKPWPWKRSIKYDNSSMFWGLQIQGGYFIHSTPHYGELGRPASMGCVRVGYPTAMEIFDLVVNEVKGSALIRIHKSGSKSAEAAFANLGLDAGWVNDQTSRELEELHLVSKHDYHGVGHARRGEPLRFPRCDDVDCFEYFGKKKPAGAL